MKTNHCFRASRRFLSAWRKTALCNIKPRRLIVERIEDRLLLAGDFQAGIELQFNDPNGNASGFISFQGNSPTAISLSNAAAGASIGTVSHMFNNGGAITDGIICSHNNGIAFISIAEGDFSPVNAPKGYIDIGPVNNPIDPPKNQTIAQKPTVQPVAETKEFPAPILKSNITPKDVDGVSGRSQVFELAMARARESNSVAMPLPDKMAGILLSNAADAVGPEGKIRMS